LLTANGKDFRIAQAQVMPEFYVKSAFNSVDTKFQIVPLLIAV